MKKQLRPIWIAVAVLPVVAGTALAAGPAMFVCRGDSIARATCCCPESQHRAPAPMSAPTVSGACCCDIVHLSGPAIPAVLDSGAATLLADDGNLAAGPGPGPALVSWAPGPGALHGPSAQRQPHAFPILLGKQSFLI